MSPQPQPIFPILHLRDDHNSTTAANATLTPTPTPPPEEHKSGGAFPGFLIAVIIIGALVGLGFLALIVYRRRASHQRAFGSAPGAPSLDGAKASLSSLWYKLRNPRDRSASAGFEGISAGRAQQQHRGRALDPDEAWDSRVGNEADAYYEDTELQGTTSYRGATEYTGAAGGARGGNSTGMPAENPFGDEHATSRVTQNPFGDEHAAEQANVRSVSPRPMVDTNVPGQSGPAQISPTRRSLFKENV